MLRWDTRQKQHHQQQQQQQQKRFPETLGEHIQIKKVASIDE